MATAAEILAEVPLLMELSLEQRTALGASLRSRGFERGEIIFQRGDPGDSLYVIQSGRIKITLNSPQGKEIVLTLLGPADFFGDLALLDGEPRSADAVALEPGRLLVLRRDDFVRFVETNPRVAITLLAILSRRLRRNAQQIQDTAFLDIPGRLARVLLDLAGLGAADADADREAATPRMTQTELAGLVGATRESVNKWLRAYELRGLIRLQHGQIVVLDPARLRAYTE